MRTTRIPIGLFVALLALTSCDGTTPQEPPPSSTGPITTLTIVGGNDQRAAGGIPLSEPLRVKATDGYGNVVTGGAVTFTVLDGSGSLEPALSITGSHGIAESRWTLGATAGKQHVRAGTGEGATAQFTAEAYCEPGQCSFELAYSLDGNVLIFDGATGGIRQLTNDDVPMLPGPEWSPDGTSIAFTRYSGVGGSGWSSPPATADVYVMYADGTGMTRVTGNAAGSLVWSHSPTWSPRGDAIAFSGDKGRCVYECGALAIYGQELSEGSVPRSVAPEGLDPAWAPDGSRIAFIGLTGGDYPGSLRIVNPDGSGLTEVPLAISGFFFLGGPTWSPDGTRIALSACNPVCNIYVVRPDGSGLIQLTTSVPDCSGCGALSPAWSPDATRIAYTALHYNESGTQVGRIMAIPADGGEPVTLVAPGYQPSWRP